MNAAANSDKKNSVILFLLWPFFALIYALRNYRSVWAKDIIWLFVVFYGFTFTIHNVGEDTIDANRYRDKFIEMSKHDLTFDNVTAEFYDEESQVLDVMESIILFLVSRITSNYHILFAVFGLILGFFYSRNIWYLIEKAGFKISPGNTPVIITFAMIVGFWELNGFRFWSATHIFFFGALPYLYEGRKSRLLFCVLSIFMHFAYAMPLIILGIYLVTGRRTNIFFFLFIATFFVKELSLSQAGDFLSNNLPKILLPRVKGYTNEDYAQILVDKNLVANWYAVFYREILKWIIVAFIVLIYFRGKKFINRYKGFENLFSFTLLLYSVSNIFAMIPSGGRFIILSNLFSVAIIFFYIQFAPRGKAMKRMVTLALPGLALYSIVSIRLAFDTMGFLSVFGNPLLTLFLDVNVTLIEIVKGLLGFSQV